MKLPVKSYSQLANLKKEASRQKKHGFSLQIILRTMKQLQGWSRFGSTFFSQCAPDMSCSRLFIKVSKSQSHIKRRMDGAFSWVLA